jgi:alanine-glyoxylate transaminase/serine-glyoxylate transaminase/serine-pyruvate transaminase
VIYGLLESYKMGLSEGLNGRIARYSRLAAAFRKGMRALGLKLLCKEEDSASTLTVVEYPEGVNDVEFRKSMEEKYDAVIPGGLGPFKEKAFRVGRMGNVNKNDILSTVSAIEGSLAEYDYKNCCMLQVPGPQPPIANSEVRESGFHENPVSQLGPWKQQELLGLLQI